ncbi:hypothetical protein HanRHA438_Chr12g0557061 [Helianthus annuus]|nr:hypothetical protein HanRHA438_Chr12g0557061 [Helianthus annuus]
MKKILINVQLIQKLKSKRKKERTHNEPFLNDPFCCKCIRLGEGEGLERNRAFDIIFVCKILLKK